MDIDVEDLVKRWEADLIESPQAEFQFTRPTPPLKDLPLDDLTPGNSRRLEAASIYADVDGFTAFVSAAIEAGEEEAAITALHVIRKELREVLVTDFGGRKIRYIG